MKSNGKKSAPRGQENNNWNDWEDDGNWGNRSSQQPQEHLDEDSIGMNGLSEDVASPVVAPTAKATTASPPTEPCVFPCLMSLQAPTILRIPRNLLRDLRVLPMVLASNAANRGVLDLFGPGVGKPVTVLMGPSKQATEDSFAMGQINAKVMAQPKKPDAPVEQVRLMHQTAGGPRLGEEEGRRALQEGFPPGSILIIYDLQGWNGSEAMNPETCGEVAAWLANLCAQGHTPVVFEPTSLDDGGLFALVDPEDVIDIDHDPAAPHGHSGGGCILRRERRGIFDERPIRWNFWYRVQEGSLRWGMEVRDEIDDDALTEHDRKVLLRRIDVAKGVKEGIEQKQLAEEILVSASTISRDVKALKKAGLIP